MLATLARETLAIELGSVEQEKMRGQFQTNGEKLQNEWRNAHDRSSSLGAGS
jgi:hypothetical protein